MIRIPELLADRYEVVRRVGTGGMADVYLARDTQLERQVALKILHSQYATDQSFIDRFRREAHAAANLQHPNVVQIYDWGREDDYHFIVMEFIEGRVLKDVIASEAPMEPREATRIAGDVLAALSYAHRAGLVHRDVKPGNVLLDTETDDVHVTDFGIARASTGDTMTQTGTILGTAYYLSPEQAQGLPLDARSDLYSLGVVLYEMVSGRRPFEGDSPVAIAYKHVREQPPPPSRYAEDIPPALEAIILTALQKRPEDRYSSATQMRRDLEAFAAGRDVTATMPAPVASDDTQVLRQVGPIERAARRRPGWLVALALALLAGGLALGTWSLINLLRPAVGSVEVPTVVQRNPDQAQRILRARNLEPSFEGNEPSDTVAAGLITRQLPEPGNRIAGGSAVRYWVSSGPAFVEVPNLTGRHINDASRILQNEGLELGERLQVFDESDPGTVLNQNPRTGQEVRSGTAIDVTVSQGPETGAVPDVVGLNEADASTALANAGFRIARFFEFNDDFEEGIVFGQDPQPGAAVESGSVVQIFISEGPRSFPMPDVVGDTEEDAIAELQDWDLSVRSSEDFSPGCNPGDVVRTNPQPGRTVTRGQTVQIFVCPGS